MSKNKPSKARKARPAVASTDGLDAPRKPPLGVEPKWLWREVRMWELIKCLARYIEADPPAEINMEWLEELESRISETLKRRRANGHERI